MNSLQNDSPEEHVRDLDGTEALSKIKELAEQAKMCFFVTRGPLGDSAGVRPMGIAKADDYGTLWFISAVDSHKNKEIHSDPRVTLYIHGAQEAEFLYLTGEAMITTDRNLIKELWTPFMKVWFTEGEDDPRLTAIKFTAHSGYYWDTKHGKAGFIIKSLISLASGKTLDDGVEGSINITS